MKIAYILPSLNNTGPNIVIQTLVKQIIEKVDAIDVYYFDESNFQIEFLCPVYQIDFSTRIDFEKYTIIHTNMYRPDKYIVKWNKTIDRSKIKLVSTVHQDIFTNLKYTYNLPVAVIFNFIWQRYLTKFDYVVAVSKKIQDLYKKYITQIDTIYNGVDIDYRPEIADKNIVKQIQQIKEKGFLIIGAYAEISKRKGLDQLFNLLDIRKDIALVIIGEGKEKKRLEDIAKTNDFTNRVIFFPYLNKPYNYLEYFDIYVMPSRSEGFGLALVEAIIAQKPIVCSNIKVFKEMFNEKEVSFFDRDDITSLSNAIDNALINTEQLINQSNIKVQNKFTASIMANNYLKLYQQLSTKKLEV